MEGMLKEMMEGPKPAPLAQAISNEVNPRGMAGMTDMSNDLGVGTIEASEEENQKLDVVLTGIESQIHGKHRDKLVTMLRSQPELWRSVSDASVVILEAAEQKLAEQGIDLEPDYFFGENGIIQSTVEMVYELAVAAGAPKANDSNQLDMAYMHVMSQIGEELYETDDAAVAEAQQAILELELGEGATGLAEEGLGLMGGDLGIPEEGMEIPAYEMEMGPGMLEDPLAGMPGGGYEP